MEEYPGRIRPLPSSFRDPSGFLFTHEAKVFRQVNDVYRDHYEKLLESGLYQSLCNKGWLIAHEEVGHPGAGADVGQSGCFKVLLPEQIPYISYPYEWSFAAHKAAAR